jgi:hypothetical protein
LSTFTVEELIDPSFLPPKENIPLILTCLPPLLFLGLTARFWFSPIVVLYLLEPISYIFKFWGKCSSFNSPPESISMMSIFFGFVLTGF